MSEMLHLIRLLKYLLHHNRTYRLTRRSVAARFSCDVDLPIDEDAVGDAFVFEPASFHSSTEVLSHYTRANVDRIS